MRFLHFLRYLLQRKCYKTRDYERLSTDVVLFDGRHYRRMTDAECAEYIWGEEQNLLTEQYYKD